MMHEAIQIITVKATSHSKRSFRILNRSGPVPEPKSHEEDGKPHHAPTPSNTDNGSVSKGEDDCTDPIASADTT